MAKLTPILYSFRRCPYAIRARLALHYSDVHFEHREILLRDKPQHMLDISPKGTVPVLLLPSGEVIDESLDIMMWSLNQHDPDGWLPVDKQCQERNDELILLNDQSFKYHLDRYKYPNRYPDCDPKISTEKCIDFLRTLDKLLSTHRYLANDTVSVADAAIVPFVRQFSRTNLEFFNALCLNNLNHWLSDWLDSELFHAVMEKHPLWRV